MLYTTRQSFSQSYPHHISFNYDSSESLNTQEGEKRITPFLKVIGDVNEDKHLSVSIIMQLTEIHVSTYVMLLWDPFDFSLRRSGGEPGGAYDVQLLGGGNLPLSRHH